MLKNDYTLRKASNKGFSLVELIVVISIMAVLVGIITPQFLGYVEKTRESVLMTNTRGVMEIASLHSFEYTEDTLYDYDEGVGTQSLNNYLEYEFEKIEEDGTYANDVSIINPYSKHMSILDYKQTITNTSNDGYRPAVFITANAKYAYEGNGSTDAIVGSVVVYFKVADGTTEYIEFYYIKKDGTKSEFYEKL